VVWAKFTAAKVANERRLVFFCHKHERWDIHMITESGKGERDAETRYDLQNSMSASSRSGGQNDQPYSVSPGRNPFTGQSASDGVCRPEKNVPDVTGAAE